MNFKDINRDEFDTLVDEFLLTQDNSGKDEWYCTHRDIAENAMESLRAFLFGADLAKAAKEERRAQYLQLKAEFEGEKP